ncbi:MAG: exo-alpha-sialidase [Gammaproteobacteria bacterium]|nr:exo-alpha-sialidase [Gammaproteobacteria bacterium]
MRVIEHREIYRDQRFHAAFPSIVRFGDDNLLLAFRRARDAMWLVPKEKREGYDMFERMDHIDSRSHITLMELDGSGCVKPGTTDFLPFNPEASDQDPSLLVLPGDDVLLASFSYYPLPADVDALLRGRAETEDQKAGCRYLSWGCHTSLRGRHAGDWRFHHRFIEPDGGYGAWLGHTDRQPRLGAVRGQPVRLGNELLLPVYWGVEEGSALFASVDGGSSWRFKALIARDTAGVVTYQEPALCPDGEGGLVCFCRTAGANGRLATIRSRDGLHWNTPELHELVGHPFHPLVLADGRVLLSYGYRNEPYGVRLRLLENAAADPDDAEEVIVRDDGLCRDIGYPWGVQLSDDRVLLVYYWTNNEGMRGIEASWLEI